MNWNKWARQAHRWLSVLFVVGVAAATLVAASGQDTDSVLYYVPLPPLLLLMLSGLYLFALPYAARWRGGRRAGA